MTLRCLNSMEIKLASLVIGGLEMIWGLVLLSDGRGRLAQMLNVYGLREEFCIFLGVVGMMLVMGAIFPARHLRHWGLWLTPMVSFPAFGVLVDNNMTGVLTFSLPFIGVMALVIYWMDTLRKPRRHEKLDHA